MTTMTLLNESRTNSRVHGGSDPAKSNGDLANSGRLRLARDLFTGAYRPGQSVKLPQIAAKYKLDTGSVLELFAEVQALGMVTLTANRSAIIHSPNPKE